MWRFIGASVIGTSHAESGLPCQDECFIDLLPAADGSTVLVCVVADGAGSAKEGSKGAEIACLTAVYTVEELLRQTWDKAFTDDSISRIVSSIRDAVDQEALMHGRARRDYACTLLCAIVGEHQSTFLQVGDGAIVVAINGIYGTVFWPHAGPYANMTHFVTDDDVETNTQISTIRARIDELAILSDGLQRLALLCTTMTPHAPFFDPMFSKLRSVAVGDCVELDLQLRAFLSSPAVNKRTDDDKSLILATRRAP